MQVNFRVIGLSRVTLLDVSGSACHALWQCHISKCYTLYVKEASKKVATPFDGCSWFNEKHTKYLVWKRTMTKTEPSGHSRFFYIVLRKQSLRSLLLLVWYCYLVTARLHRIESQLSIAVIVCPTISSISRTIRTKLRSCEPNARVPFFCKAYGEEMEKKKFMWKERHISQASCQFLFGIGLSGPN